MKPKYKVGDFVEITFKRMPDGRIPHHYYNRRRGRVIGIDNASLYGLKSGYVYQVTGLGSAVLFQEINLKPTDIKESMTVWDNISESL